MSKTIVIITAGFPFGSNEPFLETEIQYLDKKFDRVIVLPRTSIGEKRNLPSKIEVFDLFYKNEHVHLHPFQQLLIGIQLLCSSFLWKELFTVITENSIPQKINNLRQTWNIGWRVIRNFNLLEKFIKTQNLDNQKTIFYSYWLTTDSVALGLLKKNYPKIYTTARAHRFDLYEYPRPSKFLPYRRQVVQLLDAICPISDDGLSYLKNRFSAPTDRLFLMRLGSRQLVEKLPPLKNSEPFVFLSIARFRPVKRVDWIAKAVGEVARRHPNRTFRWQHFGGGEPELIQKTEEVVALFPKNIKVNLAGEIPNSQILNYLCERNAHVFINLSTSEGLPVSIMEAQSVGLPVLATDVGGVREIVNDQVGHLLPSDASHEDIVSALENLLSDEILNQKSAASFDNWVTNFDAHKNYSRFANWLSSNIQS